MDAAGSSPWPAPPGRPTLLFFPCDWAERAGRVEFHHLYLRLVHGRACRAGLSEADADFVAEDVFQRVAPVIREFEQRPRRTAFRAELIQLTHARIAERLQQNADTASRKMAKGEAPLRLSFGTRRLPVEVDDEDEWDQEWEQHLRTTALERVARGVAPRDFQVFELRVRQRWPCRKVAVECGRCLLSVWWSEWRTARRLRRELARVRRQLG